MSRKLLVALILLSAIVALAGAYMLLPKHYTRGERLNQTEVFWNDREAFFFLSTASIGRSSNFLTQQLQHTKYAYVGLLLNANSQFYEYNVKAWRLAPSGELQILPMPDDATLFGNWSLQDGKLQVVPVANRYVHHRGFRWDGQKFVAVNPEPLQNSHASVAMLSPDDSNDDSDDADSGILSRAARKSFKDAGWHWKDLPGFVSNSHGDLPINLGSAAFDLTVTSFPQPGQGDAPLDLLGFGTKSLTIARSGAPNSEKTLWSQAGWQAISKAEFDQHATRSGTRFRAPFELLLWLVLFAFALLWRFGALGHGLLTLLGLKGRMLKNLPTTYSFPSATAAQFPSLDLAAIDRYTREFEGMGFTRLLDFSLASDSATQPPNFCRLIAHTTYHCFCEIHQIFPRRKSPMSVACSIQSVLADGWSITFTDRKPMAVGSLLRRKKSLSVAMPGTNTSELLQAFLRMRDNVCMDLGISVVRDDTLQAYIAKVQRGVSEMRDAIKQKNMATAVSHVYFRKLSLLKTKEEYAWLGDYPKEAERRKQGFPPTPVRAT
ncbi:MAG TPA: hypothetical protein VJN93_10445 [Candidatus Acidoferrum sp.]|nr:hypothetical protein [Candidatus Acidoferrum sp.]